MTWKIQMACQAALACMFSYSKARIVDDSDLWTGSDKNWYDLDHEIGVKNGVPYSNDPAVKRFIEAPLAVEGEVTDYMNKENVQRVDRVLGETRYNYLFPLRNELYTYDGFLRAVGKWPHFCNEKGENLADYTLDEACKHELATMFAHFN